MTFITPNMVY